MHIRYVSAIALAVVAALALAPQALAVDINDIGFVDQSAIGSLPAFASAQTQFQQFRDSTARDFQNAIRGKSQADQQRIYGEFNQKLAAKQHELFDPLLNRAQTAIALVAAQKSLGVVVDKQIVIFGGQDITKDVLSTIGQSGVIVPPVNTPPPSEVGYVDQTQIDQLPKAKAAAQTFQQARQQLGQQMQQQMAGKSQADQAAIVAQFNAKLKDEQKKDIQPLNDQIEKAVSDVARKHKLLLVIDQADRVYGGTDVTADVLASPSLK
ncbi:MAG: OmpH family outer membrane protein [Candidatus Eremiobacteraeota bacterium]|nr:OmpH family outer membrane protein [Candidatus Eremiobacteraeota bacterium]MBV8366471.1 OmpH family outer membrane protein [Candidatus Eremiobacteraeota bacterium]